MNLHHDGCFLISHFNRYGAHRMIRTQNPGHFLLNKRLSDDFLSITTLLFNLNLLSRFDDNYIFGYPARQSKGRAWVNFCTTSGAYEHVEITTIGDELNDANFDDHNNHDRPVPNLELSCLHDTDRSFALRTRRCSCPNLRGSFATCPVDVNDWPASSA